MKINQIIIAAAFSGVCFAACTNSTPNKATPQALTQDSLISNKTISMKSYVSMFEIPARDVARAINFYEAILGVAIEEMEVQGMQMGILPYEGQMVTGVIVKAEGYTPAADGITMFLDAGDNLQGAIDKAEKNGGKVIVPVTAHADGNGHFAILLDCEGNRVGLNSAK